MKALIVGAAGFVGEYLFNHLKETTDWIIGATKLEFENIGFAPNHVYNLDITKLEEVDYVIKDFMPDFIFHLAAQSSVALSWKVPQLTVSVNVIGTINILETIRKYAPQSKTIIIGSSEEYGHIELSDLPISESKTLNPTNIYASSKLTQEMIAKIYVKAYQMHIVMTRSFNHIGPKQIEKFVIPSFCKQIAEIEKGLIDPVIYVGNLEAKRDFTDVRDIVRAYQVLVMHGNSGEIYNVGQGKSYRIKDILYKLISLSSKKIDVKIDPNKLRPIDEPDIYASIDKIKQLGWEPAISIYDTLRETLDYYRNII